jgi:hypothetical protein
MSDVGANANRFLPDMEGDVWLKHKGRIRLKGRHVDAKSPEHFPPCRFFSSEDQCVGWTQRGEGLKKMVGKKKRLFELVENPIVIAKHPCSHLFER